MGKRAKLGVVGARCLRVEVSLLELTARDDVLLA